MNIESTMTNVRLVMVLFLCSWRQWATLPVRGVLCDAEEIGTSRRLCIEKAWKKVEGGVQKPFQSSSEEGSPHSFKPEYGLSSDTSHYDLQKEEHTERYPLSRLNVENSSKTLDDQVLSELQRSSNQKRKVVDDLGAILHQSILGSNLLPGVYIPEQVSLNQTRNSYIISVEHSKELDSTLINGSGSENHESKVSFSKPLYELVSIPLPFPETKTEQDLNTISSKEIQRPRRHVSESKSEFSASQWSREFDLQRGGIPESVEVMHGDKTAGSGGDSTSFMGTMEERPRFAAMILFNPCKSGHDFDSDGNCVPVIKATPVVRHTGTMGRSRKTRPGSTHKSTTTTTTTPRPTTHEENLLRSTTLASTATTVRRHHHLAQNVSSLPTITITTTTRSPPKKRKKRPKTTAKPATRRPKIRHRTTKRPKKVKIIKFRQKVSKTTANKFKVLKENIESSTIRTMNRNSPQVALNDKPKKDSTIILLDWFLGLRRRLQ